MTERVLQFAKAARVLEGGGPWTSFVETPTFTRRLLKLLTDKEYRDLQATLVADPQAGSVMKSTGGARKLRWGAKGKGKSGGVRVIYFPFESNPPGFRTCFLLLVYPKNEKDSLTDTQNAALKQAIQTLARVAQASFETAIAKTASRNQ